VEAIVNSTARKIRPTRGDTLNNAVHRAAGPLLAKEAKLKGRPKAGLAILTGGYDMPSKNVIHVMRPGGEGHYDQLIDCYHSSFRLATANHIKTIAFPCIGTGGVGFPPRVAARIALEETRKYMDANADHGFGRLVFCVNTAPDEKAYIDFMPIYFPPTHGDLDVARLSVWSEDRTALAAKVLDTRNQVQKVFAELNIGLSLSVPDFPSDVLGELTAIDTGLAAIRRFLLWSQEVTQSLKDLKLICSVLQLLCGNITELIDLAKDHANLGQQSDKAIWDDYISDMQTRNGLDLSQLLKACHYFLASLETLITREGIEVEQMVAVRQTLERYKVKQRGGRSGEGTQDHLNEVLYTREFQREAITHRRNTVRLHQIPSVAQLYQLADLDEKPTLAAPSSPFNQIVCFAREDITTLEVDVIVSSADTEFSGIGALERSVMMKGGTDLRDAVKQFGVCSIGDVKTTKGFLLPAKHILHLIPPGQLDKKSKEVLRKTIRKALHTAVTLRATSIAFPSIGMQFA
jgi:O-acetyl-ADP-ribose deacetylase (regulator of RNase III)